MNDELEIAVRSALDAVRARSSNDARVSLLWLLLRRSEYPPGSHAYQEHTEQIVERHGRRASRLQLTYDDVGEIIERVAEAARAGPPRNSAVVKLLVARHDERAADLLTDVLDQFDPPLGKEDELSLSSLLGVIEPYAQRPRVRETLSRWLDDAGEAGEVARRARAAAHFADDWWDERPRHWRTFLDVGDDAVAAIPLGSGDVPPIDALRMIVRSARSPEPSEIADLLLRNVAPEVMKVTEEALTDIGTRAYQVETSLSALAAQAEILAVTATEDTVPFVIDALHRNATRMSFYAAVTEDRLVSALQPFDHRDDVRAALSDRSLPPASQPE